MNATVKITEITPDQAAKLLDKQHPHQRHLRESWVNRLVGEIKTGNFRLSSDALVIVEGILLNGQHRLSAVAQSGITCPFLVMHSDDPNIYKILDSGAKRNIADVITCDLKPIVASIAGWVSQYNASTLTQSSRRGSGRVWSKELLRSNQIGFIEKNQNELVEIARAAKDLYHDNRMLPPSMGAAFMFLANRERKDDSGTRFIKSLISGTSGGVVKQLRDKLINNRLGKKRWPNSYVFGLMIKAFKQWESGKASEELRFRPGESFPAFWLL